MYICNISLDLGIPDFHCHLHRHYGNPRHVSCRVILMHTSAKIRRNMLLQLYCLHFAKNLKDFVTNTYIRHQSCICRPYLVDLKFYIIDRRISFFFSCIFLDGSRRNFPWKVTDTHAWIIQLQHRQYDWLGFLSIACELCTKTGTARDPSECADASKVATRCRSDACGRYNMCKRD